MADDFNANTQWDGDCPASENFTALAGRLSELGLVSAYHEFYGEAPGQETRPTFFMYRHENRPFHLDYCFIPRAWLPG
jgi:exodeoxyribonuclease III